MDIFKDIFAIQSPLTVGEDFKYHFHRYEKCPIEIKTKCLESLVLKVDENYLLKVNVLLCDSNE